MAPEPLAVSALTPADERRAGVGATGGIPLWGSGLARLTAHEPGWATTPHHADRGGGRDGDQVVGGGDPAPGRSDRAFPTAATQMRRIDPAKLR